MDMNNTMVQASLDGDQLVLFVPWSMNWSDNTALTIRLDKEPDMLREIIVRAYDLGRETGLDEGKDDAREEGYGAGWDAATAEYYDRRYQEGFDNGVEAGDEDGYERGYEDAKHEFYDARYDEGKADGYDEGYREAEAEYEKIIQDMEKEMRRE